MSCRPLFLLFLQIYWALAEVGSHLTQSLPNLHRKRNSENRFYSADIPTAPAITSDFNLLGGNNSFNNIVNFIIVTEVGGINSRFVIAIWTAIVLIVVCSSRSIQYHWERGTRNHWYQKLITCEWWLCSASVGMLRWGKAMSGTKSCLEKRCHRDQAAEKDITVIRLSWYLLPQ